MARMTGAKVLIIQEESMDGVLVCVRCSLPQQSLFPREVCRYIAVECYHSNIRPILLQKKNCGEGQTRRTPASETHFDSKASCTMARMRR